MKTKVKHKSKFLNANPCAICGKIATHNVQVELRDKQGPPLNPNSKHIMYVCEEEIKHKGINWWITPQEWNIIRTKWKQAGYILDKRFCNIVIEPINKKHATKS